MCPAPDPSAHGARRESRRTAGSLCRLSFSDAGCSSFHNGNRNQWRFKQPILACSTGPSVLSRTSRHSTSARAPHSGQRVVSMDAPSTTCISLRRPRARHRYATARICHDPPTDERTRSAADELALLHRPAGHQVRPDEGGRSDPERLPRSPPHPLQRACPARHSNARLAIPTGSRLRTVWHDEGLHRGRSPQVSATIEVVDGHERVLATGRFATDKAGYATMCKTVAPWPERVWAIAGSSGAGRPLAQRLSMSRPSSRPAHGCSTSAMTASPTPTGAPPSATEICAPVPHEDPACGTAWTKASSARRVPWSGGV